AFEATADGTARGKVQHAVAERKTQGATHFRHALENRSAPLGRQHVDAALGMALFETGEQRLRHYHVADPTGSDDQDIHSLQASSGKLQAKQQAPWLRNHWLAACRLRLTC